MADFRVALVKTVSYLDGEDVSIFDEEFLDLEALAEMSCVVDRPERRRLVSVDALTKVLPEIHKIRIELMNLYSSVMHYCFVNFLCISLCLQLNEFDFFLFFKY